MPSSSVEEQREEVKNLGGFFILFSWCQRSQLFSITRELLHVVKQLDTNPLTPILLMDG